VTTLHLGVLDVPYQAKGGVTTGDVATWLERKYGVMERFYDLHAQQFADDLAESVAGELENVLMGAPPGNPFAQAMSDIEGQFRLFIDFEDITVTGAKGVPTQAALEGVNHRLKMRRGARRPSFVDTGLYSASFKAWVDGYR
jgi:hypothetical protein